MSVLGRVRSGTAAVKPGERSLLHGVSGGKPEPCVVRETVDSRKRL